LAKVPSRSNITALMCMLTCSISLTIENLANPFACRDILCGESHDIGMTSISGIHKTEYRETQFSVEKAQAEAYKKLSELRKEETKYLRQLKDRFQEEYDGTHW